MERKNLIIKKISIYGLILITILLTYLNYHLYKENQSFKFGMGSAYRDTVVSTLYQINENDSSFWVETLQNEEDGDVLLERYIGNLNELAKGYDNIDGHIRIVIGSQIRHLSKQYWDLESNIDKGKDIEIQIEEISSNIRFIREVLTQVQSNLDDESETRWYKELSNSESKTVKYIWTAFKNFEKENM